MCWGRSGNMHCVRRRSGIAKLPAGGLNMPKQVIVMPFSRQLIGQRHNSQTGEKVGTALEVDSIFKEMRGVSASANSANEALSGMATCRKTVTAKITGALTAIVF